MEYHTPGPFTPCFETFDGDAVGFDITEPVVRPPALSYCDYLAFRIQRDLAGDDPERIIATVGNVQYDLHPTGGYMLTTKKTLVITDANCRHYRVTVEEVQ